MEIATSYKISPNSFNFKESPSIAIIGERTHIAGSMISHYPNLDIFEKGYSGEYFCKTDKNDSPKKYSHIYHFDTQIIISNRSIFDQITINKAIKSILCSFKFAAPHFENGGKLIIPLEKIPFYKATESTIYQDPIRYLTDIIVCIARNRGISRQVIPIIYNPLYNDQNINNIRNNITSISKSGMLSRILSNQKFASPSETLSLIKEISQTEELPAIYYINNGDKINLQEIITRNKASIAYSPYDSRFFESKDEFYNLFKKTNNRNIQIKKY